MQAVMQPTFLWPTPQALSATDLLGFPVSSEQVEGELRGLYPATEPVLFSSGRAGLTAVLSVMGIGRPHTVWCPAYSSHCVLEAVAHVGTPTPQSDDGVSAALLYHQWGHGHRAHWLAEVPLIEDAVDSLLIPGCSPFIAGGDFALWSLPKVLATLGGGVVFCRRPQDAEALRSLRAARPCSWWQAGLRWRSKSSAWAARYWNGAESAQGELAAPLRRQVLRRLAALEELVASRQTLLASFSAELLRRLERDGRLPSNLPMTVPRQWQRLWGGDKPLSAGLRSFNTERSVPQGVWAKVAPLPVHADVSNEMIRWVLGQLDLRSFCDEFDFV